MLSSRMVWLALILVACIAVVVWVMRKEEAEEADLTPEERLEAWRKRQW